MATKTESGSPKICELRCYPTSNPTASHFHEWSSPKGIHITEQRTGEEEVALPRTPRVSIGGGLWACGRPGLLLFAAAIELASRCGHAGVAQRLHFVAVRRRMTWGTRMPGITGCCRLNTADSRANQVTQCHRECHGGMSPNPNPVMDLFHGANIIDAVVQYYGTNDIDIIPLISPCTLSHLYERDGDKFVDTEGLFVQRFLK
uniref:Uncharacterized protein n=1 Tax=Oryza sativa subsp. japonica TaxID=39947 RepID=Q67X85_ORYSJ|nr:hypothetical protein [Oryza sativa Japonica Group]